MMEVFLYNSNVCRLCGEENDNGSLLYSCDVNNQSLCDIINSYLPIRVSDDGQLPRTICPGCTIQLEATVEFFNLIINGQKVIRELHEREKEYSKAHSQKTDVITENIVYEINTSDGVYRVEHPISLQVAGLEKPKRKRGRPPKKPKTPEELAAEAAMKERQAKTQPVARDKEESSSGKRRRKTPTRFKEVVQGAELERILKEEGVTDGEDSDKERRGAAGGAGGAGAGAGPAREPEVIGHLEASGELVLLVKGKGRGRPKGRMRQTHETCVICGTEFSCVGRYMSHVAQHGPVRYRCGCGEDFNKRLHFNDHQRETGHEGLTVVPGEEEVTNPKALPSVSKTEPDKGPEVPNIPDIPDEVQSAAAAPVLDLPQLDASAPKLELVEDPNTIPPNEKCDVIMNVPPDPLALDPPADPLGEAPAAGKKKLKCNHCDKLFSNKQSKSMHTKAVHYGERPYTCGECGASFPYPRSLALHAATHRRRQRRHAAPPYACDLCGKVLNHPSSVVYHKQSAHAAQQYVCGACGKRFRHRQLLQRHQLVHSQARPYACKLCTATFKTKANLVNHQLLHYGVKKFACEICKHRFAHKTSLTLHMRWHSGVKPFSCEVCGKSFSQKGNLSEHERIHTGEKPYACAHCPRRFTTSSQHRLHTRRHLLRARSKGGRREGGSEHRCGACGWTGSSRAALAQHARDAGHAVTAAATTTTATIATAVTTATNNVRKQHPKQESLLVSERGAGAAAAAGAESPGSEHDERVIYVAYDMDDDDSPDYRILDAQQAVEAVAGSVEDEVVASELYAGPSLLLDLPQLPQLPQLTQLPQHTQHLPVTDEQGNPLHFTMQDGTRLAITSPDGKSLQVITQDGQTIPVEINGFTDEDEVDSDTVVQQLDLQKGGGGGGAGATLTHYYTLV